MALTPGSSALRLRSENALGAAVRWIGGLFGHRDFSPEEALSETKGIDPQLIPRVPMDARNLDVGLLSELSHMGLRRAKEITPQSHPELIARWNSMCAHAGMKKPPQLILAESKMVNAFTVSPEEVVVTTGLLKILNLRELSAVLGHELGHETSDHKTPRIIANVGLGLLGALTMHRIGERLGAFRWTPSSPLATGTNEALALMAGGSIGSIAANQLTVRPTELDADKKGAAISGDPEGLMSALRKLDAHRSKNPIRTFLSYLQSGYPSISQRLHRLQDIASQMPGHPPAEPIVAPIPQPLHDVGQPGLQISQAVASERLDLAPQHVLS